MCIHVTNNEKRKLSLKENRAGRVYGRISREDRRGNDVFIV